MSCNICMSDIEDESNLLSCGNEGCTFAMCTSCTQTYYSRRYGYRKCPQCRSSPLGLTVRSFISQQPPFISLNIEAQSNNGYPSVVNIPLVCIYLGMSTTMAWFIGAGICEMIGLHQWSDPPPGTFVVYQIILGYIWIISLIMCLTFVRYLCKRNASMQTNN